MATHICIFQFDSDSQLLKLTNRDDVPLRAVVRSGGPRSQAIICEIIIISELTGALATAGSHGGRGE